MLFHRGTAMVLVHVDIRAAFGEVQSVNWGVIAAREVVLPGTDWNSVGLHLALLFVLSVATAAFATWTFRAYQRTI